MSTKTKYKVVITGLFRTTCEVETPMDKKDVQEYVKEAFVDQMNTMEISTYNVKLKVHGA